MGPYTLAPFFFSALPFRGVLPRSFCGTFLGCHTGRGNALGGHGELVLFVVSITIFVNSITGRKLVTSSNR